MAMFSGPKYRMVTAVCLIASACAIALVNAVMAARIMRNV